ncbi:PREDICTED: uncharacterized protein LOC108374524 [Rhagoletis zephyria]|uniref:uncharacterized protein LOC108374524 n=1 Tax=Rhagoletis zephyria TaxID=28612 RepID=UPI0008117765|nr:PREDICTED: uncharacterized protein LOC108374524 [Rhagoletis zephyria]XP_017485982.1 PREDICTED: uncharacterized protein LOC108374524 [Rhagoletis zephyria]
MLASFGVLICMVSTLMGIKIWWFKHRLTFNHSSTNNGAAGGAPPTVPLRTRSSREKRMSQQISEPVEVHGVFRRREEDDLNIVPTKQLPPVRIRKLSQSTPSLFPLPPPRRQDKVRSVIYEKYEPPAREPPRPPVDSLQSLGDSPQPRTPTISLVEEMPTFDELEQKYRQMELKEEKANELSAESTESILRMRESSPQPPKRLNRNSYSEEKLVGMHKFMKAKLPSTEAAPYQPKINERRATGFLRPDEEHIEAMALAGTDSSSLRELEATHSTSVEEFGERRPTGYIKYEEIDVDGLADFREKWEQPKASLNTVSPTPYQHGERVDYDAFNGHNYDHMNRASARELRMIAGDVPASYANDSHKLESRERLGWQADERAAGKHGTPVSLESIDFTSDEEYADELGGVKRNRILKSASVPNCSVSDYEAENNVKSQRLDDSSSPKYVDTFTSPLHEEEVASCDAVKEEVALNIQQPTAPAHVTRSEQLWDELEANIKQDEREKCVWLEIEKELDFNRDFVSNIEEEFDKIRHSYEENEAAFLENTGGLKRVHEQVVIASPEPEGFGKSIDEDWESFENLAVQKPKTTVIADKHVVQYNFADLEDAYDSDGESVLRTERRPAGFKRHSAQLKRELSNIEDEDEPTSPHYNYNMSSVEFVEQDHVMIVTPSQEDRPIGYAHKEISALDDDYVREHSKDSIFEPVAEPLTVITKARARPRPRQKVTFDFSSTEYYQASNDEDDEDEDENQNEPQAVTRLLSTTKSASYDSDSVEEDAAQQAVPKPMQRTTKTYYVAEKQKQDGGSAENQTHLTLSPTSLPAPASLLFDTPISLKTAETELSESWTAISQLQRTPTASGTTRATLPALLNVNEQPKPSYRSTLAQTSSVTSVVFMEESIITQHQQQPMSSFKPQVAMRQHYFEQSYHNSTEA